MKRLVSLIVILAVLTGCGTLRKVPPVETHVRDSVAVHIKDSTVIHIDTVEVVIPKEESSAVNLATEPSHLETSVAESDAYVDESGKLHHTLKNKAGESFKKEVPVAEHFHSVEASDSHVESETITVEVEKPLTKFQKFENRGFWVYTVLLLLAAAIIIIRNRAGIFKWLLKIVAVFKI